jgi:hypothetical protein
MLLQASEEIAKKYGGNKQKIAQAVQAGLLGPTEAVLAGMFIDRIREAQAEEQAPQQTVADKVFSPKPEPEAMSQMQLAQQGLGGAPAPKMPVGVNMGTPQQPQMTAQMPRGMGATPQAAQMQAMQQKMAPRPSVAGMNQLPMGPGMIPRAASGGLLAFAGGGDVPAYAPGGELPFRMSRDEFSNLVKGGMSEEDRERLENERFRSEMLAMELGRSLPYDDAGVESPGRRSILFDGDERGMYDQVMPIGFNKEQAALDAQLDADMAKENKLFEQEMAAADRTKENIALGRAQPYGVAGDDSPGTPVGEGARVAGQSTEPLPSTNTGPLLIPITGEESAADNTDLFTPTGTESEYDKAIKLLGDSDDRYKTYLEGASERADANRKEDFYTALAQFGFNMAASGKPTFLEAAGEAGAKTMPAITSSIKDQRKAKASAEKELASVGAVSRAQNIKLLEASMASANAQDRNKLAKLIADEKNTLAKDLQEASAATQLQVASIQTQNPTKYETRLNTYVDLLRVKQQNGEPSLKGQPIEVLRSLSAQQVAKEDMAAATARLGVVQDTQNQKYRDSFVENAITELQRGEGKIAKQYNAYIADGKIEEANALVVQRARDNANRFNMGAIFDKASTNNEPSLFGVNEYSKTKSFSELPENTQKELSNTVIEQGGVRSIADPTNKGKEIAGIPVFNANGDITAHIKQSAIVGNSRSIKELEDAGYTTIRENGVVMGFIK